MSRRCHATLFQPISNAPTHASIMREILIVDDSRVNRRTLERGIQLSLQNNKTNHNEQKNNFAQEHYHLQQAVNGLAAVVAATKALSEDGGLALKLIFMDRDMPQLDGDSATIQIRELEKKYQSKIRTPIICYSADISTLEAFEKLNARIGKVYDGFISKPFNHNDLKKCIDTYTQSNFPTADHSVEPCSPSESTPESKSELLSSPGARGEGDNLTTSCAENLATWGVTSSSPDLTKQQMYITNPSQALFNMALAC